MDRYEIIETYQGSIELTKIIRSVYYLQDNDKQYVMELVETYKQVYLFYQSLYQSNEDYPRAKKNWARIITET